MQKYTKFPKTLYRLQNSLRFKLKEHEYELIKGRNSYDHVANEQGLYIPRNFSVSQPKNFEPNGVQLFSMSENFKNIILSTMKGALRYYYVVEIPEGTALPDQTVLLQDPVEDFVFWLETEVPIEAKDFNSKIELMLLGNKIHRKKEFKPLFAPEITKKDHQGDSTIST
jgi:hypothetical protein